MKIIFMGTPEIAVPSLLEIAKTYDVIAVYTQPDRPSGRGKQLSKSAVKIAAESLKIPVFQPLKLNKEALLLKEQKPDCIVVMAYGQILSSKILEIPSFGCINIHASLLPLYRGAAPIQWAIINGETKTGVTIMRMDKGLDTGDMIYKANMPILEEDNAKTIHEKMSILAKEAIIETLPKIFSRSAVYENQPDDGGTYASMLTKEMGLIDFSKTSKEVVNQIRGMYLWPIAYTFDGTTKLKIYEAKILDGFTNLPGKVLEKKSKLIIATGDGAVEILKIQPPAKKVMESKEFLAGNKVGDFLG